jgi:hypothetical protein
MAGISNGRFHPAGKVLPSTFDAGLRKGFVADLGYYFLSSMVPRTLLVLPLSVTAWLVHRFMPGDYYQRMGEMRAGLRLGCNTIVKRHLLEMQ